MHTDDAPEGTVILQATPEKIDELWDRMSKIRGIFDDYTRGNKALFVEKILRARDMAWYELTDGTGVVYLSNVIPGLSANAHFLFWDRKLRSKEGFVKQCMKWAINRLNLMKVNVQLPDYAVVLRKFVRRLGLKYEGKARYWSYYNGRLFDMYFFGITREEALNGFAIQGVRTPDDRAGPAVDGLANGPAELPSEPGSDAAGSS